MESWTYKNKGTLFFFFLFLLCRKVVLVCLLKKIKLICILVLFSYLAGKSLNMNVCCKLRNLVETKNQCQKLEFIMESKLQLSSTAWRRVKLSAGTREG